MSVMDPAVAPAATRLETAAGGIGEVSAMIFESVGAEEISVNAVGAVEESPGVDDAVEAPSSPGGVDGGVSLRIRVARGRNVPLTCSFTATAVERARTVASREMAAGMARISPKLFPRKPTNPARKATVRQSE
mgnify:CR=1 FL=1